MDKSMHGLATAEVLSSECFVLPLRLPLKAEGSADSYSDIKWYSKYDSTIQWLNLRIFPFSGEGGNNNKEEEQEEEEEEEEEKVL